MQQNEVTPLSIAGSLPFNELYQPLIRAHIRDHNQERETPRLQNLFRERMLHRGWNKIDIELDGHSYNCFHVPPNIDKQVGIIAFMTGCESSPLLFAREVNHLSKNGYHIIGLPQVNRRQFENNNEHNLKLSEYFLFDERSPLQKAINETGLDSFLIAHSAGVLCALTSMHKPENIDKINFKHIFKMGGFLGSANSTAIPEEYETSNTKRLTRLACAFLYGHYGNLSSDFELGEGPIDSWFMDNLHGGSDSFRRNAPRPTHGEAIELREMGMQLIKDMERVRKENYGVHPFTRPPSTSIFGTEDRAACIDSAKHEADISGSHFFVSECGHDIFTKNTATMSHITHILDRYRDGLVPLHTAPAKLLSVQDTSESPFDADQGYYLGQHP